MKIHVLTVKQPRAHLIVHGYKSASGGIEHKLIENRTRRTAYRGELYIHAGKSFDTAALDCIGDFCPEAKIAVLQKMPQINAERGQIIGRVQLNSCLSPYYTKLVHENCWAEIGAWHWMLSSPEAVAPFPARGQLGIWTMDAPPLIETLYFEE